MKKYSLLLLIIALFLAACNGDTPEEEEPEARPTPTTEVPESAPNESPNEEPQDGYPADQPTAPAAGYPDAATEVWLVLPAGSQCADALAYPDSASAVADLEAAGVEILAVEETELLVCEACGCPTSAHYRILLAADDIPTAIALGWQQEP